MLKNIAGQIAQSQMVTAADGSAFAGTDIPDEIIIEVNNPKRVWV